MKTSALRAAGLAVLLIAGAAACTSPVRLATPSEIKQATQATPSPAVANPVAPNPAASPGATTTTPGTGGLAELQAEYHALITAVLPSIVEIDTSGGMGSGVVIDAQGDIATNAHVVSGETRFTVRASDGSQYQATLVGAANSNDLAVIRAANPGASLKPVTFGDSSKVALGDIVVAIGSPLGLSDSVSEGIVSGTSRTQPEGNGVTLTDLIQTTAAINPGNSGGALVDIGGQVIGMPTLGASSSPRSGAAAGIGFAISSNQVVNITQQLISGGTVAHTGIAYLGISTSDAPNGGAQVDSVVSGSPADKAGLKAGWVITAIGGRNVPDANGVGTALSSFKPGQKADVKATLPDGSTRTVSVTLGERP